jgi:hypothetical protein
MEERLTCLKDTSEAKVPILSNKTTYIGAIHLDFCVASCFELRLFTVWNSKTYSLAAKPVTGLYYSALGQTVGHKGLTKSLSP